MDENTLDERLKRIERFSLLAAKNMLNIEDASFLTGISKSTLYKYTCTNQIPHYKPNGRVIYFDRKEIDEWMKRNRVNTIQESESMAANYVVTERMKKQTVL